MDAWDLEAELRWSEPLRRRQTQKQRVGLDPSLLHLLGSDEDYDQRFNDNDLEDSWLD